MPRTAGRHFLQIPGPTNVPDRVLRAIDFPTMDHRGPEFADLGKGVLSGMKRIFKSTKGEVVIYPASGTGAWEAALVNSLSPGDRVLMAETGHFATLWQKMAAKLGLEVEFLPTDWRHGADPDAIEKRLRADPGKRVKAVCVVHNETSTGVTSRIGDVRRAIDAAGHPALYMVDTISSLASIDYRHDEWGVDVTVAGSQKGLMLPPGLEFADAARTANPPFKMGGTGSKREDHVLTVFLEKKTGAKFAYLPYKSGGEAATQLVGNHTQSNVNNPSENLEVWRAGQVRPLCVFDKERMQYRTKVTDSMSWNDIPTCKDQGVDVQYLMLRAMFLPGKVFRIGHLGDFNDLALMGTLAGVEMGLTLARVPVKREGVRAAMEYLSDCAKAPARRAA
ncbi:MAG: aminotransferase class V-fold PLP-dependent enzyme [Betaproteobacteria bacterium]|nr:MAG: aminotransferase class V-fold PLP-dependent enzyme [Betaproteobacteria bacterium]